MQLPANYNADEHEQIKIFLIITRNLRLQKGFSLFHFIKRIAKRKLLEYLWACYRAQQNRQKSSTTSTHCLPPTQNTPKVELTASLIWDSENKLDVWICLFKRQHVRRNVQQIRLRIQKRISNQGPWIAEQVVVVAADTSGSVALMHE